MILGTWTVLGAPILLTHTSHQLVEKKTFKTSSQAYFRFYTKDLY